MIKLSIDVVVEKGENYIRYDSGLQICFGEVSAMAGPTKEFWLPKPFKDDDSVFITLTPYWNVTTMELTNIYRDRFYVTVGLSAGNDGLISYKAIGWWK